MAQESTSFHDRLQRIEGARELATKRRGWFRRRRNAVNPEEPTVIVYPDGYTKTVIGSRSRLRFRFPIKGLFLAATTTLVVKAFLMWAVGPEAYDVAVAELSNGSEVQRLAGLVLAPDVASLWLYALYDQAFTWLGSLRPTF